MGSLHLQILPENALQIIYFTWLLVYLNFSKTAERKKTPLTGIKVRLNLSSIKQTDRKSVISLRIFFQNKVPYQMTYFECRVSRFTKIDHQNTTYIGIKNSI